MVPNAPMITVMTFVKIFYILIISLARSWYLTIFYFSKHVTFILADIIASIMMLHHFTPCKFFILALADELSLESEWQQIPRTLLSILADLSHAVVWNVSIHPLISSSSNLFSKPLVIILITLATIGITVTLMFHNFLFSSKVQVFLLSFHFLLFSLRSTGTEKSTSWQVLFFLLIINNKSGLLVEI